MPVPDVAMRSFTGLTVVTVMFLLASGLIIARNRTIDRTSRRTFIACLAALGCLALVDWFVYYTNGRMPELRYLHTVLVAVSFALAPFLPVFIANTICPERRATWVLVALIILGLVEIANIFGGFVFWVDESNTYHRGPLYVIYSAAYILASVYIVVQTFRASRAYQTGRVTVVFGILACMFSGVIMQVIDMDVRMTWPAASMAVVLYFLFYSDMVLRTDALTKLLNRRSFEDALEHPSYPCIAVIIDVDNFKSVNDTYGHAFGDECLIRVAEMILQSYGSAGLCYRTGGDELAVIMTKRLDDAELLSSELKCLAIDAKREDSRMPSVSVGYAPASADGHSLSEAFRIADQSMYEAKWASKAEPAPGSSE